MYYILNKSVALRSWKLSPYAFYIRGVRDAQRLTKEEYEILKMCDSLHDIEDSDVLKKLVEEYFAIPCKKGEYSLLDWQDKSYDNRYFPSINWMITGKCNYNCLHCFNAADNSPLQSEWTLDEAKSLLDQARDCGINAFTITGGEPMLHKNFFEILEAIYERNMFVYELNTNGYFISQEALDHMKKIGCKPLMKISFDGISHHDWLRNKKGAEEDALRAISLCVKNGFKVKVQTNVHRYNLDSIQKTLEILDEIGVDETRIIRTSEAPRWLNNSRGATLSLKEYTDAMYELWQEYISENHKMNLTSWQIGTLTPKDKTFKLSAVECPNDTYRDDAPVCKGNRGMIAIGANGHVYPCHQLSGYYEQHNDILGDLKKESLKILLSSGKYVNEVCTTLKDLKENNEKCRNCKYFKYCCGGCRAIALAITNNKLAPDPSKCFFFENDYYNKFVEMLKGWKNLSLIENEK